MGCQALDIWVAFFKQPDALPGHAPQKNKINIFLNYFWFICDFFINDILLMYFFWIFFVLYQAVRAVSNKTENPSSPYPRALY
jgi:hypothetical protein